MEIWKDISEFSNYEISSLGRCRNKDSNRYLSIELTRNGYYRYSLCKEGKIYHRLVHRLLGIAFIPNPDNLPQIDHIDDDSTNNNLSNLQWISASDNIRKASHPVCSKERNSFSGHKYIYYHTHKKHYLFIIRKNKIQQRLGCFKTLEEALKAKEEYFKS